MNQQPLRVTLDEAARRVEIELFDASAGERCQLPWAVLRVGEESGAGVEVEVEACEAFDLILHWGTFSFFESVEPGRQRFMLTVLDRSDVRVS